MVEIILPCIAINLIKDLPDALYIEIYLYLYHGRGIWAIHSTPTGYVQVLYGPYTNAARDKGHIEPLLRPARVIATRWQSNNKHHMFDFIDCSYIAVSTCK